MTRSEMIDFIKENPYIHITHILFDESEYIYSGSDGIIYDEYGNVFEDWETLVRDGIRYRTGGVWENSWSIKED